jgi:hypothetical protein
VDNLSFTEGEAYKKEKRMRKKQRLGRFEGDRIYYFALHNILSAVLFFWIGYAIDLFSQRTQIIEELFKISFIEFYIQVFALNLLTSLFARFITYVILYLLIVRWRQKDMKKFGEINTGIDSLNFTFLLAILLGSFLFAIGVLVILQNLLFGGTESFLILLVCYFIMRGAVYLLIKLFSQSI